MKIQKHINQLGKFFDCATAKIKKEARIGIEPSLLSGGLPPILQHCLGNSATLVHLTYSAKQGLYLIQAKSLWTIFVSQFYYNFKVSEYE